MDGAEEWASGVTANLPLHSFAPTQPTFCCCVNAPMHPPSCSSQGLALGSGAVIGSDRIEPIRRTGSGVPAPCPLGHGLLWCLPGSGGLETGPDPGTSFRHNFIFY